MKKIKKILIDQDSINRIANDIDLKSNYLYEVKAVNKIRQHIPNFITGAEVKEVVFKTIEELLDIDFVKNFKREDFYRYSLSGNKLMAEYKNGNEWCVIGHIDNPYQINLPKLEYKNKK